MKKPSFFLGDPSVTLAGLACILGLGIFLLWASFVPLAEGVNVGGKIIVEDKRKVVQHFEGGIIRTLNVREGETVQGGDVLMEIEDIRARSNRDQTGQILVSLSATLDRLRALNQNATELSFTDVQKYNATDDVIKEAQSQATALFFQQRESNRTEISVLEARRKALRARSVAQSKQMISIKKSTQFLQAEIDNKRPMLADNDITIDEIQRLERELAALEGDLSRAEADRQQALAEAAEVGERIAQVTANFREKISNELLEAQTEFLAREEEFAAAQNVLERTIITAPQSGRVMNMNFTTIGGVVGAGEAILEIVPDTGSLVAQVQVSPTDRDSVYEGLTVKAQLSAYKNYRSPTVDGKVLSVSADLKTSPDQSVSYYEALIELDASQIAAADRIEIIPGMPVEAFVDSGTKRTFMTYLLEPIIGVIDKGVGRG